MSQQSGLTKSTEDFLKKAAGHLATAYFLIDAKRESPTDNSLQKQLQEKN